MIFSSIISTIPFMSFYSNPVTPGNTIPSVTIKTLTGESLNSTNIIDSEQATLLIFWATCCAPCKQELTEISKSYDSLNKEMGVNVVAVSVDLPRYADGVKPFIESRDWKFPVYLDVNRELMHAMNAQSTSHTFLLDKEGKIVWEKQGFSKGDEVVIHNKIAENLKKG